MHVQVQVQVVMRAGHMSAVVVLRPAPAGKQGRQTMEACCWLQVTCPCTGLEVRPVAHWAGTNALRGNTYEGQL